MYPNCEECGEPIYKKPLIEIRKGKRTYHHNRCFRLEFFDIFLKDNSSIPPTNELVGILEVIL